MSLEQFLDSVQMQYQKEGVNFHCYLRENFFRDVDKEQVKEANATLTYFMPEVFCQQHINSCEISTALTMFKKVVADFKELQEICFAGLSELPKPVQQAQEKIALLELEFDRLLATNMQDQNAVDKLMVNYLKQVQYIQVEMEKEAARCNELEWPLYVKTDTNHFLSTAKHMIYQRSFPWGEDISYSNICAEAIRKGKLSLFQGDLLSMGHFQQYNRKDLESYLYEDPNETPEVFYKFIKHLFMFGKTKTCSENMICSHSFITDIDGNGCLEFIEHKNAKTEKTWVSMAILSEIGLTDRAHCDAKQIIKNIDGMLGELNNEKKNLKKERASLTFALSDAHPLKESDQHIIESKIVEIDKLLELNKQGIDELKEIKTGLLIKMNQQFKDKVKQSIPDTTELLEYDEENYTISK